MTLRDDLQAIADVRENEAMARHTTFGVGGPADLFVVATTRAELTRATLAAREADTAVFVLGSGSNILVSDEGIRGVVLENKATLIAEPIAVGDDLHLKAEAGVPFASLTRHVARAGLSGLEWAAGIPGTLGGAVIYNAGAYGGCLADALHSVTLLHPNGREEVVHAPDLGLSYRSSVFTRGLLQEQVVLDLTFDLEPIDSATALTRIDELEARRKASAPRGRNAGSTFKNPVEHPVWWLIDQVGMRGYRIGDAQVSEVHTNYFLNVGAATSADLTALIQLAQSRVHDEFGIELQPEVAFVGGGAA
ncbi:MAG TPA: UDP-N-acetylmuramate dehydrogenase [Dehalococcoidia bacterium]|nr:UDP-N-acetylmuramate dehydrogenase [Dehalococcoidia bacterium]